MDQGEPKDETVEKKVALRNDLNLQRRRSKTRGQIYR